MPIIGKFTSFYLKKVGLGNEMTFEFFENKKNKIYETSFVKCAISYFFFRKRLLRKYMLRKKHYESYENSRKKGI